MTNLVSAIVHKGDDGTALNEEMAQLSEAVRDANAQLARERAGATVGTVEGRLRGWRR